MTSPRIIWANRRSETHEAAPTTSSMPTLMMAIAVVLVTCEAAPLMAELPNAAPRAVSMNGTYWAVKLALAARM